MYKIDDVARRAGVAKSTVSNYLNGRKIREPNKLKIDQAILDLNYHPNIIARGLKNLKGFSVGVLVSSLRESFSNNILAHIENYLQEKDYSVVVCSTEDDENRQRNKIKFLLDRNVDGIVILSSIVTEKEIAVIRAAKIPVVLVDKRLENADCDSVAIDNVAALKTAVGYLAERGHRDIALVSGMNEYSSHMRRKGYRQALEENGIEPDESRIIRVPYTIQGGYEGMSELLKYCPDVSAVVVSNFEQSAGFIMAANERNISIPEAFSVVGFDNLNLAALVRPKLTMLSQPMEEMGRRAADIIYNRILGNYENFPFSEPFRVILEEGNSVKVLK